MHFFTHSFIFIFNSSVLKFTRLSIVLRPLIQNNVKWYEVIFDNSPSNVDLS
jgi:hypothetical protein